MPFVGIPSFLKLPIVPQPEPGCWDFLVLGIPFDEGSSNRPGARFGPRAIRAASTLYSYEGGVELFDVESGRSILVGARVADAGDVPILPAAGERNRRSIEQAVGRIAETGATPVCLGGDHSVTASVLAGLAAIRPRRPRPHLVHVDAHMDFDSYLPRHAHGTPVRIAVEERLVSSVTQVGIRGLNSGRADWLDARERGVRVVTAQAFHEQGPERGVAAVLEALPEGESLYLSIDIDGFDPSIAPGTGTPEPGGLQYPEVRNLLRALTEHCPVVGLDLVEVNPAYDHGEITAVLATRVLLDVMGDVWEGRRADGGTGLG